MGSLYEVSASGNIDTDGYISIGNGGSATYRVNNVQISTANLSDGASLPDMAANETITGNWSFTHAGGIEVTNDVNAGTFTGNGAALTALSEANITDGSILARVGSTETITGAWTFNNGGTAVTVSGNTSLDGTVVINDSGEDKDFRVEGANVTDLLFVDASLDNVGIGTSAPAGKLDVASGAVIVRGSLVIGPLADTGNILESSPYLTVYGRAGKGLALGANDNFGAIAAIQINSADTAVVINETGVDRDFRVEGDTLTHLLFTDASTDRVGVGDSSPNALLTVGGVVSLAETTAPALTAGYGKIYVKSLDSKLYFKDDAGAEFDLTAAASLSTLSWTKYTISFTDAPFNTAALTDFVTLFTPSATTVIHAVRIKHSAAFTDGGAPTVTVSVGVAGDAPKYASAFNVSQAAAAGTYQLSANLNGEDGATAVILTATSTVNLSTLTAGSVDVWVLTSAVV